jgi:hypothetical protein
VNLHPPRILALLFAAVSLLLFALAFTYVAQGDTRHAAGTFLVSVVYGVLAAGQPRHP